MPVLLRSLTVSAVRLLLVLLLAMTLPASVGGVPRASAMACGHPDVTVVGTAAEKAAACRALDDVMNHFAALGLPFEPKVSITFKGTVLCDLRQDAARETACPIRVSGLYDFVRDTVEITSPVAADPPAPRPWGLEWGPDVALSILQHELVHMAVDATMGEARGELAPAWHEFVAYAVQFDLMPPALREDIMEAYGEIGPFGTTESVNPVIHAADPDAFGVRAFLFAETHGGDAFVREILLGGAGMSTGPVEYLWTP